MSNFQFSFRRSGASLYLLGKNSDVLPIFVIFFFCFFLKGKTLPDLRSQGIYFPSFSRSDEIARKNSVNFIVFFFFLLAKIEGTETGFRQIYSSPLDFDRNELIIQHVAPILKLSTTAAGKIASNFFFG